MNIYVLNKSLERIGIIDTFSSIIWTNRYYSYGDFELYVPANNNMIMLLQEGFYLVREGKESNAMIIEAIQISTDVEQGNYLTVKGRCLKSILYRRIIWNITNIAGLLESGIARLLNENIISPNDSARKIDNFENRNTLQTNIQFKSQYTGDNLGESVEALCQNYGIGWDVSLDIDKKKFYFELYKGEDRSYDQKTNPWIIFSNEYENLLTTDYTYDTSAYSNVCKVAGEGEGIQRKYVTVGNANGLYRYESYVDARDLSTNDGEISDIDYYEQLIERGNESLAEKSIVENFEGEVEANYTYKYGKDYFLGDIVEVINEYDIAASTRIVEVIESEDETGTYTIPTFSNYISKEV